MFNLFGQPLMHVCLESNHNFEARYTIEGVDASKLPKEILSNISSIFMEDILEKFKTERYICDVCTFCGKIVKP